MAKRELQEINAGSMADIAFLLLVFFLVTTTLATDQGIERSLPKKEETPPIIIKERNMFNISINFRDQMSAEGKYINLDELDVELRIFFTNPGNKREDMPEFKRMSKLAAEQKVKTYEAKVNDDPNDKESAAKLETATDELRAIEYFGEYRELPDNAFVAMTLDKKSSYERFIDVYNTIEATVNGLRNEASLKYFEKPMLELDETIEEDRNKLKALRLLYPKRIVTPELKNS